MQRKVLILEDNKAHNNFTKREQREPVLFLIEFYETKEKIPVDEKGELCSIMIKM